ncbi:hypothetical protein QVD17_18369 [Tagetes erecta]|uniref:Cullin family profile domain-containing protein n=1 Tax=Tagetes erecta TaxID=13708 RepID=A0AAD8NNX7_TARER|nr:hypothetical protein QVD17_18369 [Tagetes erecta]
MSRSQSKTNFQIEAYKHKVVVDSKYADRIWRLLEHAINEIYNQNASGLSFEELYRNAYNMVLHKYGEKLYTGVASTMTSHLVIMSKCVENVHGEMFLDELHNKWVEHNKALRMICDILMYMDRSYVPGSHKRPARELGLNLWRDNVIHLTGIQTQLQNTLLHLIHKERTGQVINRGIMRNTIKMLMDLGPPVYQVNFERPFLEASREFYKVESREFIECCDCGNYLQRVEARLNEEMDRVSCYLNPKSEVKITNVVEKEMIANHMTRLVHMEHSGLVNMILDDKYEDLRRMYNLFRPVPNGLSTIQEVMTSYLRETGIQLVNDPEKLKDPVEFVQGLLNKKDKYDKIITLAFNNDRNFQNAMNSTFEFFINCNPQSHEYISLFVDDKMRKDFKGVSETDVEVVLDKLMMVFRYLHEKDIFEKYYKQHLAKRLLSGKGTSEDAERSLVLKLKTECGYQFTSKLEGMLTDMKTSRDIIDGFYLNHGAELGDSPGLLVQVLTTNSWPIQPSGTCNLPAELTSLCDKFRSYYLGTHSGRRLSWQTSMGTADIKVRFVNGQRHELNVSTYQMCVLMLFNDTDQLTYTELERATGIPSLDLKRSLQSMACVKGKNVLRKEPMSKDVKDGDVFFVNEKFTNKFFKVKIGTMITQNETEPEKHKIRERVEEDRKPQIEAAIVRIMKARRVLDHNNLMAEVIKQLQPRFLANPIEIKKRIESLIERDFLERDGSHRKLYRYIA